MTKIRKQIITASVTGTLALMGAPPEAGQPARNAEVTSVQPAGVHLVGTLTLKGTKYFLTDTKTGVVTELRGKGLNRLVGMTVTVDGKLAGNANANAPRIVQVDKITGNAAVAAKSSFADGKGTKATLLTGAAAGTVGGLYAAGALGEDEKSASRP